MPAKSSAAHRRRRAQRSSHPPAPPDRRTDERSDRQLDHRLAGTRRPREALGGRGPRDREHHDGRDDPVVEAALHGDQPPDRRGHHRVGHHGHPQRRVGGRQRRPDQQREPHPEPREQPCRQPPAGQDRQRQADAEEPRVPAELPRNSWTGTRAASEKSTHTRVTSTSGLSVSGADDGAMSSRLPAGPRPPRTRSARSGPPALSRAETGPPHEDRRHDDEDGGHLHDGLPGARGSPRVVRTRPGSGSPPTDDATSRGRGCSGSETIASERGRHGAERVRARHDLPRDDRPDGRRVVASLAAAHRARCPARRTC